MTLSMITYIYTCFKCLSEVQTLTFPMFTCIDYMYLYTPVVGVRQEYRHRPDPDECLLCVSGSLPLAVPHTGLEQLLAAHSCTHSPPHRGLCRSFSMSLSPSVFPSIHLSVDSYTYLSVCLSLSLSLLVHLSVHTLLSVFFYLSILLICPSILPSDIEIVFDRFHNYLYSLQLMTVLNVFIKQVCFTFRVFPYFNWP